MPQTTRWRFDEVTEVHYTMYRQRVKWFAMHAERKWSYAERLMMWKTNNMHMAIAIAI
jgi:hypothetical protein